MLADSEPLVRYRRHSGNMSRNYARTHHEVIEILKRHRSRAEVNGDRDSVRALALGFCQAKNNVALHAFEAAASSKREGSLIGVLKHFLSGLWLAPEQLLQRTLSHAMTFVRTRARRT